jgi:DNA topoisomerase-1
MAGAGMAGLRVGAVFALTARMAQQWILRKGHIPGRFTYRDARGRPIPKGRAKEIDALAIPPAWTDVHIAQSDRSAIQAWGYDARGRKQYRYHPRAVQKGQLRKYYRVRQMARDLPSIRSHVYADFRKRGLPETKVLAGVVRFLADGFFRVGSERYAKENQTFGITTLNKRHVTVDGDVITFEYVGKRSIAHKQVVVSRDLARFIDQLLKTPGRRLFRYESENAGWCNVESRQVNEYLQALAQFPYTAKDFRTWGGTLRAATVLAEIGPANSAREANKNVVTAMRLVAAELGNTPTICRKSYVHPVIIDQYLKHGETIRWRRETLQARAGGSHLPEEKALIVFLDTHFPERRRKRRGPG